MLVRILTDAAPRHAALAPPCRSRALPMCSHRDMGAIHGATVSRLFFATHAACRVSSECGDVTEMYVHVSYNIRDHRIRRAIPIGLGLAQISKRELRELGRLLRRRNCSVDFQSSALPADNFVQDYWIQDRSLGVT